MFGRATIRLGIGPHSSSHLFLQLESAVNSSLVSLLFVIYFDINRR